MNRLRYQMFAFAIGMLIAGGCAAPPQKTAATPAPATSEEKPIQMSTRVNAWSHDWTPLFDGKTLANWAVTDFEGHGEVSAEPDQIKIGTGVECSGITWTNGTLPKTDYEISLEAMKIEGSDFFCGLTFPVADSSCTLIVGGWGGGVVGLSCLDGMDASENETTKMLKFDPNHWYQVRLRVTPKKIQAWIDEVKLVDTDITGRKISLRTGPIYRSEPLGVATYQTTAALRDFKLRLAGNP